MPTRTQTHAVATFQCLGDQCPDTCCKGWGMQLTAETIDKFKAEAPELMDAVTSGEAQFIMKRDPATDYCVKFDAGWCSIHRDYGPEFLGDACHFYPRVTRALDDTVVTGIALSCPEAARSMLYGDDPFALVPREEVRVPYSLRNYAQAGLSTDAALALHAKFVAEAGNAAFSAERNALRILVVTRALVTQPIENWPAAADFYFTIAESRLPTPEPDVNDLNLLSQSFTGLILASATGAKPGLVAIAKTMQASLGISIDENTRGLVATTDAMQNGLHLLHRWKTIAGDLQPVLARYLQAQVSQALFPFAGLGGDAVERMVIIAVRLATFRLALIAHHTTDTDEVVRIAYSLSRFLDHLADPTLSLAIYQETGWIRDARLRALLGDA